MVAIFPLVAIVFHRRRCRRNHHHHCHHCRPTFPHSSLSLATGSQTHSTAQLVCTRTHRSLSWPLVSPENYKAHYRYVRLHSGYVLFHSGYVLFHSGYVLFHLGCVFFGMCFFWDAFFFKICVFFKICFFQDVFFQDVFYFVWLMFL